MFIDGAIFVGLSSYVLYKLYKKEPPTILNIFDFDGTVFKSPMPSEKLWSPQVYGKIKSEAENNGLGWFQDPITLSVPYVPLHPSNEWFNESVVSEIHVNSFISKSTY